ncbi:unnamed protein product [Calypogeia fissa]
MKIFTILFVAAVLGLTFALVPSAVAGKSSVDIINGLQEVLWVHCKSGDNDLQWQQLQVNQDYRFEFHENIIMNTVFWCRFTWGPNFMYWQEFTVWDREHFWDMPLVCGNCVWEAQAGGMYIWDNPKQTYDFWKPWNVNGSVTFANDTNPPGSG